MQGHAIKIQQLVNEINEYENYDWNAFSSLSIEEKIAEHSKISYMLLKRKMSRHFYLQKTAMLVNENKDRRSIYTVKNKIMKLATLIDVLDAVTNQMEMQIILLK